MTGEHDDLIAEAKRRLNTPTGALTISALRFLELVAELERVTHERDELRAVLVDMLLWLPAESHAARRARSVAGLLPKLRKGRPQEHPASPPDTI